MQKFKKVLLGIFIGLIILIVIANLAYDPPKILNSYKVNEKNLSPSSQDGLLTTERSTVTLYTLSTSNVRSGPGKNHDIIGRLQAYQEVELFNSDSTDEEWYQITFPEKGYIFHTLVGTKEQVRKRFIANLEVKITNWTGKYIIYKIIDTKIYVSGEQWYWLDNSEKRQFMIDFAIAQDFKQAYNGYCNIYDFGSGQRLISYNLNTNSFY